MQGEIITLARRSSSRRASSTSPIRATETVFPPANGRRLPRGHRQRRSRQDRGMQCPFAP